MCPCYRKSPNLSRGQAAAMYKQLYKHWVPIIVQLGSNLKVAIFFLHVCQFVIHTILLLLTCVMNQLQKSLKLKFMVSEELKLFKGNLPCGLSPGPPLLPTNCHFKLSRHELFYSCRLWALWPALQVDMLTHCKYCLRGLHMLYQIFQTIFIKF